nr:iron-siderophore ABC transporter substrate-binding protein [Vibrio sp. JPW-9-11-11]
MIFLSLLALPVSALDIEHEMGVASFEVPPSKVVALDWALTETVLSLGVELQGVADVDGYQQWVVEPTLNANAINVGSRREPNIELLSQLKPDVILISQHMAAAYQALNDIAPVLVFTVYNQNKHPLDSAASITRTLGTLLGKEREAQQVIEQTHQVLKENGQRVRPHVDDVNGLLFARFINDKTLRVHSQGSLADATIKAMGLRNDWQQPTNLWGFTTTGIEKLAEHQQSKVLLFGPLKAEQRQSLQTSPLWQAMAFTRRDDVYELPAIWTFGGLIAAQRFSDNITKQLTTQSP